MMGLHDALEPVALTPHMEQALLALSYLSPVHENYLWMRIRAHHATVEALIARGLVRREDYHNARGQAFPFLALTVHGARHRELLLIAAKRREAEAAAPRRRRERGGARR